MNQATLGVVSSSRAHSVDKRLLISLYRINRRGVYRALILLTRFVHTGKQKVLVIDIELVGYLSPIVTLLFIDNLIVAIDAGGFKPTTVPMDIYDGIHIFSDDVAHNFAHTVKPCRVNRVCGCIAYMAVPCTGNTYSIEAKRLQPADVFLIDNGSAPMYLRRTVTP